MPFNEKEQEIIKYGYQNGKSKDQVKEALTKFRMDSTRIEGVHEEDQPKDEGPSYLDRIRESVGGDIADRVDKVEKIKNNPDISTAKKGFQIFGQGVGMAAHTLETTVGEIPGVKQVLDKFGEGIHWLSTSESSPIKHLGDAIGNNKTLQTVVHLYDTDESFKNDVDAVANIVRLGGDVDLAAGAAEKVSNITKKVVEKVHSGSSLGADLETINNHIKTASQEIKTLSAAEVEKLGGYGKLFEQNKTNISMQLKEMGYADEAAKIEKLDVSGATTVPEYENLIHNAIPASHGLESTGAFSKFVDAAKSAKSDIVPTADRIVNEEVTKALQLTAGDVANIESSTGNVVGRFLADNNLIGKNLADTQSMIKNFKDTNYSQVREAIGKVEKTYKVKDIPRYKQALTEIKGQIDGVAGQESKIAEVDALLKKKTINLMDAQRVKELIDDTYNLYKVTGDVREGVQKQGFATMRSEIRKFIEDEVKANTGEDIFDLNNKVSTSRSILDASEKRSTSGLTKSNIKMGDLGIFGVGSFIGSPLFGAALLFGKKIIESPAIRFRIAKWLDGVSDARKLKIEEELSKGSVPQELEKVAVEAQSQSKNLKNATKDLTKNSMSKTIPLSKEKVKPVSTIYYHGTTAENKASILKNGINPSLNTKGFSEQGNAFYVGDKVEAGMYGDGSTVGVRAKKGAKPKILDMSSQEWADIAGKSTSSEQSAKALYEFRKRGYDAVDHGDELEILNYSKFEAFDPDKITKKK